MGPLAATLLARTKRPKNSGLTQDSTRPKNLERERERYWIWILDTDTDEDGRNLKEMGGRSRTR